MLHAGRVCHAIRIACLAAALLLQAAPLAALAQAVGPITVVEVWARATPPGASVGGAYFTIVNAGGPDTLIGVDSPVAGRSEMHIMSMKGALMQMRPLQSVPVPAHGRVHFKPGGMHVMLLDLRQPLKQGAHFPMTLIFQRAGRVSVEVPIGGFAADAPPPQHDGGHGP
ncbi:MAG TPA: copper chaperone PCu(A)C [Steroidobacteraceae bacterium]|nr:copper chaperone PCu(A)C [Steroidobacteraceae bacterium]